ncbi:MAG TPA: sensor histidine kinase, partial [Bacteroidia bacterium]
MKLYTKLSLINSVSKALIFFAFILLVPFMVKQVVLNHTDKRLLIMKERVMDIVNRVGSNAFIKEEGDSSYSSYNILKEEYISLESEADSVENYQRIENTQRNIENVVVDYRVLSYVFQNGGKKYLLEIGKSIANIS